ncbi:hypothetical protein L1987_02838 [Smallanthus sonchifolius]|uniref:Uncharacterized protein n=1 Tax=Smallanthus sonchifolius TaxID=185202 RepID=A0ACB9K940_9ASTR|nr:hypothetical protein L1987_02838 [Smallanthus sonchifolius]
MGRLKIPTTLSAEARVTIARSRFETLAEVAWQYTSERNNTVVAASSNSRNTLVRGLLSIHRAYMTTGREDYMPRANSFLTTSGTDEELDRAIRILTRSDEVKEAIRLLTTVELPRF